MMDYTLDNIGEWVAELANKPQKEQFRTYNRVMRDKERQETKRVILAVFNSDRFQPLNRGVKDVIIINDNMAIITVTFKKETKYIPVVNGKIFDVYWFSTFEAAMLGVISILKTGNIRAVEYVGKLLDVEV